MRLASKHVDQWNRIEGPEINPCLHGPVNLQQGNQEYTMRKEGQPLQQIVLGKLDSHMQKKKERKKLDPYFTPYPKINSKWIKDLNGSPETMKLLEENTGGKLLDIGLGNDF